MVSVAIGTVGAISAYFFQKYSFNESDPIKGQPLPLPYYLWVFGCGLVFWLIVLLWPKLHYSGGVVYPDTGDKDPRQRDIHEVLTLINAITTINLFGCLVLPFRELSLLVRFLVLFQLSSNLALLLIQALLSIHKLSIHKYSRRKKEGPRITPYYEFEEFFLYVERIFSLIKYKGKSVVKGGRDETRPALNPYDDKGDGFGDEARAGGWKHAGDGDGGEPVARGSEHDSEAGGKGESGGGDEDGGDGGEETGGEGQGNPEHGVGERNNERTFNIPKITEMSIMLTGQTTAAVIGFHLTTQSSSIKVLLVVVLVDLLVAYLCGLTSVLLELRNPGVARVFARIGFACTVLGYILMVAMFVHWYIVLIIVLLFGVLWIIFFLCLTPSP